MSEKEIVVTAILIYMQLESNKPLRVYPAVYVVSNPGILPRIIEKE